MTVTKIVVLDGGALNPGDLSWQALSARAVLMHGGIGFTWEHDMHLWFKRARFNESYFGSPAFHRERVAMLGAY